MRVAVRSGMLRASVESTLGVAGWIACVTTTAWISSRAADHTREWSVSAASLAAAALVAHREAAAPSEASPPAPVEAVSPERWIESAIERTRTVSSIEAATRMTDDLVDVEAFTQRSFGAPCPSTQPCRDRWATLDVRQKEEMVALSRALLSRRILRHAPELARHAVTIVGAKEEGPTVRVRTRMTRHGTSETLQIDYVVASTGGRWRLVNVVAEGASMTKNHYDQYERMLADPAKGYAHLVARVQKKAAGP